MLKKRAVILFTLAVVCASNTSLYAKPDASVKFSITREENPRKQKNKLLVPYGFSADSLGLSLGIGGMMKGYGQDQLLVAGTALGSFDDAAIGVLGMWDFQLPVVNRLFFSAVGSTGDYPRQRAYVSVPRPENEAYAGSNDSGMDDYYEDSGTDSWMDFKLEYVLPIGDGSDGPMESYKLKNGLLSNSGSGGETWNPLTNGTTVLMLKQFNRYQSFDLPLPLGKKNYSTHPLKVGVLYNNTDFPTNPSTGSSQYLAYTRDFSWGEYAEEWDFVEFETSTYFDLGAGDWSRQQVVALNLWTGYSPSFSTSLDAEGNRVVSDDPPFTQGAKLGGLYRMRAYPSNRFHDKAVLYGSVEYRWTPHWNPIGNMRLLKFLQMDWMQFVPFLEVGRVADDYDPGELLSDLKVDGGLSFRAMMAGGIGRFDMAVSEEGSAVWVMFGHPF